MKKNIGTILAGYISGTFGALVTIGLFIFAFSAGAFTTQNNISAVSAAKSELSSDTISKVATVSQSGADSHSGSGSLSESSLGASTGMTGYQDVVIPIARKIRPSVVGIRVEGGQYLESESEYGMITEASGVVYSADGYILTNHHVITDAIGGYNSIAGGCSVNVFVEGGKTPYQAQLIGYDTVTDLALLKIDVTDLSPAKFGNSDKLEVGEMAVAVGSPGGIQYMGSVSQGIISGIDREVEFDDGIIMQLIQTDAAVNPGNSGGALVNYNGEVIGINNSGLEKTTYEGINFAIPSNVVIQIAEELKKKGYVANRAWLGVMTASDEEQSGLQSLYDLPGGVFIRQVVYTGPASKAGIMDSDIIISIDDVNMTSAADLRKFLNGKKPGDPVTVKVYRPLTNKERSFYVKLGEFAP